MHELAGAGNRMVTLRCVPSLADIARDYLAERQHLKPSTLKTYRHILQAHLLPKFGDEPWESVDVKAVGIYRSELAQSHSGRTANHIMGLLRAMTAWAGSRDMCRDDLRKMTAMSSVREEPTEIDPLTKEELDLVLRCIKPRYRQFYACAAWTGARPSELAALRWRDVDFATGEIHITKARVRGIEGSTKTPGSKRRIPLFPPARIALELQKAISYSDPNQYVFVNSRLGPFSKGLDGIWKRAAARAAVRHRPSYQLRHTFASMCLAAGESPAYVAKLLGHSTPETTFRCYARWIPDERRDGRMLEEAIVSHYERISDEKRQSDLFTGKTGAPLRNYTVQFPSSAHDNANEGPRNAASSVFSNGTYSRPFLGRSGF